MPLPKSVKFSKNGVEYLSNCDRLQYTINELSRAALRDTGKYICREARKTIKKRTGRLISGTQYWVRSNTKIWDGATKNIPDLQVGYKAKKPNVFYGMYEEIGTAYVKKNPHLTKATYNNITTIQQIQQQYLSAVGSESAESKINEGEYQGE